MRRNSCTPLAAVVPAYPTSSFASFQCCILLLLMAMEPTGRPGCFSKTAQCFCPRMWSMLLMVTQKCMSGAFYPLDGFQHCFCPELSEVSPTGCCHMLLPGLEHVLVEEWTRGPSWAHCAGVPSPGLASLSHAFILRVSFFFSDCDDPPPQLPPSLLPEAP